MAETKMKSIKKEERDRETWLANYQGQSLIQWRRAWRYWNKYLGEKDEAWILENKDVEDWGAHLVNFHRWIKKQPKQRGRGFLSDNTAKVYANGIRGYLKHIGVVVNLNKVQKIEITSVESQPTLDYPFDLKTKEALLRVANTEEEYIVSAGVSFGLRVGDFRMITRGMLEPLIEKEVPIQLPKLITRKEGVPAYPFIDRDAKEAIKRLLREMTVKGKTGPSDRMLDLTSRQIGDVLKNLFKKAGVPTADYTVRFHILRKFLTDKLAGVCSGDKWRWFVGKKTTSPYVASEGLEAYKKVMGFTCINGDRARESSRRIEQLERKMEELRIALLPELEEKKEELEAMKLAKSIGERLYKDVEKTEAKRKIEGLPPIPASIFAKSDDIDEITDLKRDIEERIRNLDRDREELENKISRLTKLLEKEE